METINLSESPQKKKNRNAVYMLFYFLEAAKKAAYDEFSFHSLMPRDMLFSSESGFFEPDWIFAVR